MSVKYITAHLLVYPASSVGHISVHGGHVLLRAPDAEADDPSLVPGALGLLAHQGRASVTWTQTIRISELSFVQISPLQVSTPCTPPAQIKLSWSSKYSPSRVFLQTIIIS